MEDALRAADKHFEVVDSGALGGSMEVCPGGIDRTDMAQFWGDGAAKLANDRLYFSLDGVSGGLKGCGRGLSGGGGCGGGAIRPVEVGRSFCGENVDRREEGGEEGRG